MSVRRSALAGDRFDERYRGAGAEDVELSWRLSERHLLLMTPRARPCPNRNRAFASPLASVGHMVQPLALLAPLEPRDKELYLFWLVECWLRAFGHSQQPATAVAGSVARHT